MTPPTRRRRPDRFTLYELAVQHPPAEVNFLCDAHHAYSPQGRPALLREDFAGTAAISRYWLSLHESHRAICVERDPATIKRAERRMQQQDQQHTDPPESNPGSTEVDVDAPAGRPLDAAVEIVGRATLLEKDAWHVTDAASDITCALNFSIGYLHDLPLLMRYLNASLKSLKRGGILVVDVYGGPGAWRESEQQVTIEPGDPHVEPFTYHWRQHQFDLLRNRTTCCIDFSWADGTVRRNAFRYDWRLWSPVELIEAGHTAGFKHVEVWCDGYDSATQSSDGQFEPVDRIPAREDWVAYVVFVKG